MQAIGYCRVSTDEQAAHGASLETQEAKIRQFCDLHEHDCIDVLTDAGVSGKAMNNRPQLLLALDYACKHKALLVVYSISRLGRDTRDLIGMSDKLNSAGAQFASISELVDTTTAAGKMYFNLMAVFAQFERDTTVERNNVVKEHKRQLGECIGNNPFGFTATINARGKQAALVPLKAEMEALKEILANPDMGFAALARHMTTSKHLTRTGKSVWDRGVLRRIIKFHESPAGQLLRRQHGLET